VEVDAVDRVHVPETLTETLDSDHGIQDAARRHIRGPRELTAQPSEFVGNKGFSIKSL
jgi:hypothetical protein